MMMGNKRGRRPKKKVKEEFTDSDEDYNLDSTYTNGIIQAAVDTISEDYTPDPPTAKKPRAPKKRVDEEFGDLTYHKISIPLNMRSVYWKYFGFPADQFGGLITKKRIICSLCTAVFTYLGNTSNMKSHLSHKHPAECRMAESEGSNYVTPSKLKGKGMKTPQKEFQFIENSRMSSSGGKSFIVHGANEGEQAIVSIGSTGSLKSNFKPSTSKQLNDMLLDFIVLDLQPPNIVNSIGFKYLLSKLKPNMGIVTEEQVTQEFIPKMYDKLKNSMYNDITALNLTDTAFSLGLDNWHCNGRVYVSYYINYLQCEDVFSTKLLHTFCVEEENINNEFYHQESFNIVCTSWNMKVANIKAIILSSDNTYLHNILLSTGIPVIPCLVHTIDSMCLESFKYEQVANLINKCRAIVTKIYNKNHFAVQVSFEPDSQNKKQSTFLSIDNPEVWTSTLTMMEALCATKSKLDVILEISDTLSDEEIMTDQDWILMNKILELYKPIKVAVVTLCEEQPAHASLILPLYLQLVNVHLKSKPNDYPLITHLKSFFVDYLQKKYSSVDSFLQICTALDPRVKRIPHIHENDTFSHIKDLLVSQEPSVESTKYYSEVIESEKKKSMSGMEFLLGGSEDNLIAQTPSSHEENMRYELDIYKKMTSASLNDSPLKWWKTYCNKFPNVYSIATKYNSVPSNALPYYKMDTTSQCMYFEKRRVLSVNCQHVMNHLLFLHHNYSV